MVDKAALRQVFHQVHHYSAVSIISTMLNNHSLICDQNYFLLATESNVKQ